MSRLLAVCAARAAPLVVRERGTPETVISAIAAPIAIQVAERFMKIAKAHPTHVTRLRTLACESNALTGS